MIVKVLGLIFLFIIRIRFPKGNRLQISQVGMEKHLLEIYANLERSTASYGKIIWI